MRCRSNRLLARASCVSILLWFHLLFVCAAVGAIAQTAAAPTCADLHLVPAVRECTAVECISSWSSMDRAYSSAKDPLRR